MQPENDLAVSVLQHATTPGDINASMARLERAAAEAASQGSDLLVTPECGITGYNMPVQEAQLAAFELPGPISQQVNEIAIRHGIAILYGFMERYGEKRYNSVCLTSHTGEHLLHYRKTHLWGALDRQLFAAGDSLAPVVEYKGWRISTLICYDVEFPETVRSLALAGAQLVMVPTALMAPFRFVAEQMVPVRAAENQLYLAYANLVGQEGDTVYEGCSTLAGPDGDVLLKAPSEEEVLLHAVLRAESISNSRQQLPYHRDRRPELYAAISQPPD